MALSIIYPRKMNPIKFAETAVCRLSSSRRGQTALEYMLMIAVIFSILALVIAMTAYVNSVGAALGGSIDHTRAQVIDWILT